MNKHNSVESQERHNERVVQNTTPQPLLTGARPMVVSVCLFSSDS